MHWTARVAMLTTVEKGATLIHKPIHNYTFPYAKVPACNHSCTHTTSYTHYSFIVTSLLPIYTVFAINLAYFSLHTNMIHA